MAGHNQNEFIKDKPCLTNLIVFYDELTGSAGKGRAVDINYLDFFRASVKVSHGIPVANLTELTGWVEN